MSGERAGWIDGVSRVLMIGVAITVPFGLLGLLAYEVRRVTKRRAQQAEADAEEAWRALRALRPSTSCRQPNGAWHAGSIAHVRARSR